MFYYLLSFGGGKTISAVRRAYNICKTHKGVTVLTNLTLYGFPEDTRIIKLVNSSQILELPDKSIVLIDEIGSIFNAGTFQAIRKNLLYQNQFISLFCSAVTGGSCCWVPSRGGISLISSFGISLILLRFVTVILRIRLRVILHAPNMTRRNTISGSIIRCCHYGSSCITAMFRLTSCGVSMILLRWLIPCLIRNTYQMRRSWLTEPEPDSLPILSAIRKRSADLAGSVRFYPVPTVCGFRSSRKPFSSCLP